MHSVALWPTLIVLAICVVTDLRSRRILNVVVVPFLVAGICVQTWMYGWHGLGQALLGLLVGGGLFFILAVMGGMGMGDVKLCAAIGAWIGPLQMFVALVLIGIAGGIMAVAWATFGGFLGELFQGAGDVLLPGKGGDGEPAGEMALANPKRRKLPYAPAIALGTLISFFSQR